MSTSINIDNYESFYLDYLEGNLNESDTALLLEFLDLHPDLMVEEDALAYLPEAEFVALDNQVKSGLKFPDTEQKIGINNIEVFLIASVEKQLSAEKSRELQIFLNANPFYAEELSLYQRSRLQADLSIVFPEKQGLKKRGGIIVPMYARFAAAAASVAIAITIFTMDGDKPSQLAFGERSNKQELQLKPLKNNDSGEQVIVVNVGHMGSNTASKSENLAHVTPVTPVVIEKSNPDIHASKLKFKKLKTVNTHRPIFIEQNMTAQHVQLAPQPENRVNESYAMVDMKNPIQPITNRISEVIKRDVDFKTSKAAKKKSGGFYLKIGKFEISRKMYDNTSVAVNQ